MCSHRSSPRSSLHTLLVNPSPRAYPPHTTNPGRARSQTLAPSREARHTPVRRQAPTRPLCLATRVQISGRARTREVAHREAARVLGAILGLCVSVRVCVLVLQSRQKEKKSVSLFHFASADPRNLLHRSATIVSVLRIIQRASDSLSSVPHKLRRSAGVFGKTSTGREYTPPPTHNNPTSHGAPHVRDLQR